MGEYESVPVVDPVEFTSLVCQHLGNVNEGDGVQLFAYAVRAVGQKKASKDPWVRFERDPNRWKGSFNWDPLEQDRDAADITAFMSNKVDDPKINPGEFYSVLARDPMTHYDIAETVVQVECLDDEVDDDDAGEAQNPFGGLFGTDLQQRVAGAFETSMRRSVDKFVQNLEQGVDGIASGGSVGGPVGSSNLVRMSDGSYVAMDWLATQLSRTQEERDMLNARVADLERRQHDTDSGPDWGNMAMKLIEKVLDRGPSALEEGNGATPQGQDPFAGLGISGRRAHPSGVLQEPTGAGVSGPAIDDPFQSVLFQPGSPTAVQPQKRPVGPAQPYAPGPVEAGENNVIPERAVREMEPFASHLFNLLFKGFKSGNLDSALDDAKRNFGDLADQYLPGGRESLAMMSVYPGRFADLCMAALPEHQRLFIVDLADIETEVKELLAETIQGWRPQQ